MGLLERFRAWIWRTEEKSNELEYGALDRFHDAEDRVDEATHGQYYDALEKVDEEAGELLDRVGLGDDEEPRAEAQPEPEPDAKPEPGPPPPATPA
jgi:hypothetical protein